MTDLDLLDDLSRQMRAFTADDVPPADLGRRVHAGIRRRRNGRLGVVAGIAAAGAVASVTLVLGEGAPSSRLQVAGPPPPAVPTATGMPAPGPSDAQLRGAQWFGYSSVPFQPDAARAPEQRWESRDGRHLALQPDGRVELYNEASRFPFGPGGLTFDELLALPADPAELARRMRQADGGRPVEDRVLDQVRQLLARSPALQPVRKALVQALLLQDGVELVGDQQDSRGRQSFVVRFVDSSGAVNALHVDPVGYRLLEDVTTVGPTFPAPPSDGPVPPGDGQELQPGQDPTEELSYTEGDVLYTETFLAWSTEPPPAG